MTDVRRREFITLLGGTAAAWPLAARAQQAERVRRIGVLTPFNEGDPEVRSRVSAFQEALREAGWVEGRNMRIDYRWAAGDLDRIRAYAAEIVGLAPRRSSAPARRSWPLFGKRPKPYRLYSRGSPIPSASALLRVWRDRAAILPGLRISNRRWVGSGCRNSKRWRRA